MTIKKSSKQWLRDHVNDIFVQKAQIEGYRSRAVYKLAEIDSKEQLLKAGMSVIELGAAPGGWVQYVAKKLGRHGIIIAVDLLPMEPVEGVKFICGDFQEEEIWEQLKLLVEPQKVDLILSDMAPNITGVAAIDIPRSLNLVELVIEFSTIMLKPGGSLLVKIFQGSGFDKVMQELRLHFAKVVLRKPSASRARSREVYLLAKGYYLQ